MKVVAVSPDASARVNLCSVHQANRRQFVVRSVALALLAGTRAEAQPRRYRVGSLVMTSATATAGRGRVVVDRLEELGYREGKNLVIERRYAEARPERLPALAAELVALKPDVILASTPPAALAVARATSTIPIVFTNVPDPVGIGLVKSLSRPGTNVTGISTLSVDLHGKRLQLIKEVFPSAARLAVLHSQDQVSTLATLKEVSKSLGLALTLVDAKAEQDFVAAFKAMENARPQVLYVVDTSLNFLHRARIVEFANNMRLPAVYGVGEYVDAGGLMSYALSLTEHLRAAANYVDKILKGANPAQLPVEQATRFELVLNLKTAKAQGVTFPPAIVLRADRVIE